MMGAFRRRGRSGRMTYFAGLGAGCLLLGACANQNVASRAGPETGAAISTPSKPRVAKGSTERPALAPRKTAARHRHLAALLRARYSAVGLASWYGPGFHGLRTADGETFDMNSLTAAHRTLPLPCRVRVTNLANHRSIVVRVNDRGPYAGRRVIDVSAKTAKLLGFYRHGLARVKVEYVGRAPLKDALYRRSTGG